MRSGGCGFGLTIFIALCVAACGGQSTSTLPKKACVDNDGDSFGVGADCAGPDCNDNDATAYQSKDVFADTDGDGLGSGSATQACVGIQAPLGKSFLATDCNDQSPTCTTSCVDGDGDGLPACAGDCDDDNPHCDTSCLDADNDGYCANHDCADQDSAHYADCGRCIDADGDSHGPNCDRGGDCNDANPNTWATCAVCSDADHDGRHANCDAYVTVAGPDCDDSNVACGLSCADADNDGLRACAGDCNDTGTLCLLDVSAGDNGTGSTSTGDGGSIAIDTQSLFLLAEKQALPSGRASFGRAPTSNTAWRIEAGQSITKTAAELAATVSGLVIAAGGELVLTGTGPFVISSNDHVLILGKIRTTSVQTLRIAPAASGLDATVAGEVDASGRQSGDNGGEIEIGSTVSMFENVYITGRLLANAVPGNSTQGGAGGSIRMTAAASLFSATTLLARGGGGVNSGDGGEIELVAPTVVVRGDAIVANGGAGLEHGGRGGVISVVGHTLAASAGLAFTLFGGGTSSAGGVGGKGGTISATLTAPGNHSEEGEEITLPTVTVAGGSSAQGQGGAGGELAIAVGSVSAAEPSVDNEQDKLWSKGVINARGGTGLSGGAGGVVTLHVGDKGSELVVEANIDTSGGAGGVSFSGGNGGALRLGRVHDASLPAHSAPNSTVVTTKLIQRAALRADAGTPRPGSPTTAGGHVHLNVHEFAYEQGATSALGSGGECLLRQGATATGAYSTAVSDSNGDADAGATFAGDLDPF